MAETEACDHPYPPGEPGPVTWIPRLPAPPRISGTAMPHGVFLSTGTTSTGSALSLFITGFSIVSLGLLSLVPTYVIAWTVDAIVDPRGLSLVGVLLGVGGPADPLRQAGARIAINLLTFLVFLVLMRLSPLAAHHAAEHMTVHAIERYGLWGWEERVADMPRAHLRCGSNLLAGVLPTLLLAVPLLPVAPLVALPVAFGGWLLRYRIGYVLQNTFTTRVPTPVQLGRGIESGQRLILAWLSNPAPPLGLAQRMWRRGVPQLVAGVICALYGLGAVADHLHVWLDW